MTRRALAFSALGSTVLFATLWSSDASAFEFGTRESHGPYHSSQNFALEIRVSPYTPQVDDEPGLKGTPFKDNFGDSPRIAVAFEFDWQLWRIPGLGTIGPAYSLGRVQMSRDAHTITGRVSGDTYSLLIYPMYFAAVLRADVLWRNYGIPLMPYAKAGMAVGLWEADNALGTSHANGSKGSGASFGTNLAIGGTFPLDFFDRGASRGMDATTGINTTSLYFEYYSLALNGFGSADTFRVGTNTWSAGMTFEF